MHSVPAPAPRGGWSRATILQTLGILCAWLAAAVPHAGNDGLWYVGDAARHALNGIFWWDFLSAHPADPREYVLRYYARYPAITPLSYPPFFYLLEGLAFRITGSAPLVAKWLVVCCSLLACLTVAAWLRRYVAPDAGWGGALLALQPGVLLWSNAVMLNIPAMAVGVIALYQARRWLEQPSRRRLLLAIAFGVLTALTYFPAALLDIVLCAWLASEGRWRTLWREHRYGVLAALGGVIVLAGVVVRWVPLPFMLAYSRLGDFQDPERWLFYLRALPRLLSPWVLLLAALAIPAALIEHRWRREVRLLVAWIVIVHLGLTYFYSQHHRYALLSAPAVVLLAMIGLRAGLEVASRWLGTRIDSSFAPIVIVSIALQGWIARGIAVPAIDGMREVVAFVVDEAPSERVLYEGAYDGTFTFYLRAQDPDFRHAVVRGSKLLYASATMPRWRLTERVGSAADVIAALQTECGCAWVVIERESAEDEIRAVRHLREALRGPQFRLVRSFALRAPAAMHVDVYQFLGHVEVPAEVTLPFPVLGKNVVYRARPIER